MTIAPFYKTYAGTKALDLAVPVIVNSPSSASDLGAQSVHVVRLHVIVDKGVLRVFVEHPFFAVPEGEIYSSYTANGAERNVPAAMDVLCQASLAASILVPAHVDQLRGWSGGPLPSDITGHESEQLGQAWDVQSVFVANDWPTSILPLHLLAIQAPSPHPEMGHKLFCQLKGSNQVAMHSRPPVPACQHLAHLPNASPADKAWHEAFASLHGAMQEALQSSEVLMAIHNMAYQGAYEPEALSSLSIPSHLVHFLADEDDGSMQPGPSTQQPELHWHSDAADGADADHPKNGWQPSTEATTWSRPAVEAGPAGSVTLGLGSPPGLNSSHHGAALAAAEAEAATAALARARPDGRPDPTAGTNSNNVAEADSRRVSDATDHATVDTAPAPNSARGNGGRAEDVRSGCGRASVRSPAAAAVTAGQMEQYEAALLRGCPAVVALGALEVLTWHTLLGELRVADDGAEGRDEGGSGDTPPAHADGVAAVGTAHGRGAHAEAGVGGGVRGDAESAQHGALWGESVPLQDAETVHLDSGAAGRVGNAVAATGRVGVREDGDGGGEARGVEVEPQRRGGGGGDGRPDSDDVGATAGHGLRKSQRNVPPLQATNGASGAGAPQPSKQKLQDVQAQAVDAEAAEEAHHRTASSTARPAESVDAGTAAAAEARGGGGRGAADGAAPRRADEGRTYLGLWPLWVWDRLCTAAEGRRRGTGGLRRAMNWLRAGLRTAAALVTVSPAYAREIQEDPEQGMGLMDTLARRGVHGIINGLDTAAWDPRSDPYLSPRMRFTPATAAKGKAAAKRWLQAHLGLPVSSAFPLVAYVGRLTHQKGVDVLLKALHSCVGPEELARETLVRNLGPQGADAVAAAGGDAAAQEARWQVVLMGTGDEQLERELRFLPRALPRRTAAVVRLDERLAHRLVAAADILVVPSRFEPCGLVALAALRYGAVPVVASTGGLRDIVAGRFLLSGTSRGQGPLGAPLPVPVDKPAARAFGYEAGCISIGGDASEAAASVMRLRRALDRAIAEVGTARFRRMQQGGMRADVGWDAPAASWHDLITSVAEGFAESSDDDGGEGPPVAAERVDDAGAPAETQGPEAVDCEGQR